MTEGFYILILPSIHFVMKVEKDALAAGVAVELVPTPRQISSDCGMAVKFQGRGLDWVLREMKNAGMPEGLLYRSGEEGNLEFLGPAKEYGSAPLPNPPETRSIK